MQVVAEETERDLVIALKAGEESAFRRLFDLHFRRLYNFSLKFLKNSEQAEEVVQDVFLTIWINRRKINDELSVLPYLYTITRRLSLNALRRIATSQKAIDQLWTHMAVLTNETEETVLLNDLTQFTESALDRLPPQQRIVFKMSRYEGLNYDEIAARLDLSPNTVKNHLVAALKNLKKQFNGSDSAFFILMATFFF
ncbi:RNA polymerase sigma-70 factor [Pedobacter sp. HMF7647]|uniref:RNA polymerase sigma factor n=1 Tax=Hufsiella arboris TaxID=2695275 RepID=A0A7K1Y6W3_9SPHI|nr:RNA polymerase sigma-70 factor [Hufsiella arboris]MXV50307.1 RNA polymerase sigma-70 factor [Hufsiella arboris]